MRNTYGVVPLSRSDPTIPVAVRTADGKVVFRQMAGDNYGRFEEINFETPWDVLKDLLEVTGGYVYQNAAVTTEFTKAGEPLLLAEMWMPGGPLEPLSEKQKLINMAALGMEDDRIVTNPFTFLVGEWRHEIELPAAAKPSAVIDVEREALLQKLRRQMSAVASARYHWRKGGKGKRVKRSKHLCEVVKREAGQLGPVPDLPVRKYQDPQGTTLRDAVDPNRSVPANQVAPSRPTTPKKRLNEDQDMASANDSKDAIEDDSSEDELSLAAIVDDLAANAAGSNAHNSAKKDKAESDSAMTDVEEEPTRAPAQNASTPVAAAALPSFAALVASLPPDTVEFLHDKMCRSTADGSSGSADKPAPSSGEVGPPP